MKENYLDEFKHSELLKEFLKFYLKEHGEIKVKEISSKVHSSEKTRNFILKAKKLGVQLGTNDYLGTIHSIMYFTFSKAETISLASIILLSKWENEVGTPAGIADNYYLNKMFFRIIENCKGYKVNLSGNLTFFDKFYEQLESIKNKYVENSNKNKPTYWIKLASDFAKNYDFESNKEFAFFFLVCSIIYFQKFPEEVHQIGYDYTNESKNEFIDLVLKKAIEYDEVSIDLNYNSEFFDKESRVENSLKFIAQYIDNFSKTLEIKYLNMIAYNIYDMPMLIDFEHIESDNSTYKLTKLLSEVMKQIQESL